LTVVLDTNIVVVIISSRSKYHWIYNEILEGRICLAVSTEILLEYSEIITRLMNERVAELFLQSIVEVDETMLVNKYFQFNLLQDKDDNKFVDCAIAANAHYLVSDDNDFKLLNYIKFPRVNLVKLSEFESIYFKK